MNSFKDKTIWVTGGVGYLGSVITEALDAAGANVLCFDIGGRAETFVKEKNLRSTRGIDFDFSNTDALPAFVDSMIAAHGLPDGLAHLAFASSAGKRLEQIEAGEFQKTLDLNLTPTFVLCRHLAGKMKARGSGSVVLFSSMYGIVAPDPRIYPEPLAPNPIDYGAAKAAILQMSRYLAVHYGPDGIRFNCVTPGPFPNLEKYTGSSQFLTDLCNKTALRRVGINTEIVGPTLFLLSEGASFVTGHSLVVDGGWTAW